MFFISVLFNGGFAAAKLHFFSDICKNICSFPKKAVILSAE